MCRRIRDVETYRNDIVKSAAGVKQQFVAAFGDLGQ